MANKRVQATLYSAPDPRRYPTFNCCEPYCLGIKTRDLNHRNDEYKMISRRDYGPVFIELRLNSSTG